MHQLLHQKKDLTCRKNLAQQWMKGQVIAIWSLFVLSLVWLNVNEAVTEIPIICFFFCI